jgi:hypothetical protein
VLQQQLIKAERERILQQIQSGALPADTAIPVAKLFGDEDDLDEDEIPESVARKKLRRGAAAQQKTNQNNKKAPASGGHR